MKRKKALIYMLVVLFLIPTGYGVFYLYKQSKIVVYNEKDFFIEASPYEDIAKTAENWAIQYANQNMQKYQKKSESLTAFTVTSVTVLDEEYSIVQVDFEAQMKEENSPYFTYWGIEEGNKLTGQWVLYLNFNEASNGKTYCYIKDRTTVAAYDLSKYNSSGQKEMDEYDTEYIKERPYEKKQYTYKIENKVLSVSYDAGSTWIKVPVNFDSLTDGRDYKNKLPEGSYQITKDKTVIVYGGTTNTPLTIIYSENQGKNWNNIIIKNEIWTRYMYVHFTNNAEGRLVITSDKTMSQEASLILSTTDGGATWKEIGPGPSSWLLQEAVFFDEDFGFFSYPSIDGMESNLFLTRDGGRTFEPVILPTQELPPDSVVTWEQVYDEAKVPTYEDNILTVLVTQGNDGDYKGGNLMARYQSTDKGKTWQYIDQIYPEPDPSEG